MAPIKTKYINGRMSTRKNYINNTFVKNAYKNAEHRRRRSALSRRLGTVRSLLSRTRASRRSNA